MAIHVLCADDTRALIDDLAVSLRPKPGELPVVLRPILLPSVPLRERIRNEVARRLGVALGIQFILPGKLTDLVSEKLGLSPLNHGWTPDGLFWRVLLCLDEVSARFPRLKALCVDEGSKAALARAVADQFDQYHYFRPEILRAWDGGKSYLPLPEHTRDDEAWQREIWKWLREEALREKRGEHASVAFDAFLEKLARVPAPLFACGLEVLATGPLPASVLRLLAALGQSTEVRLRLLLPSTALLAPESGPSAPPATLHPLLRSLGKQASGHLALLQSIIPAKPRVLPSKIEARRELLPRIQRDLRANAAPSAFDFSKLESDRSLRIHRCHGPRREIEALRDELLDAAASLEGLKAEEIMVLAPDLDTYGPLAEALLPGLPGEKGRIPMRLAESSRPGRDSVLEAVTAMVHFAMGRAALSEGLALLDTPALRRLWGEDRMDELKAALQESGITFGFDEAHRRSLEAGELHVGTWRHGLARMIAGFWFGAEDRALSESGRALLPLADSLESGSALGDLISRTKALLDRLRLLGERATPAQWADRLEALASDFLEAAPDEDSDGLPELCQGLRDVDGQAKKLRIGLPIIRAQLEALAQDDERQVRQVGGHGAIGGLKPLRALPCRVLALVGLSDGAFPRRSSAPSWNLLAADPQPGDRDPRLEDRELFLDSLLSAADRVILTAPARNLHTDKNEPLSICVEELRRCLHEMGRPGETPSRELDAKIFVDHPLQPFSPSNFGNPQWRSFDAASRELCAAAAREKKPAPPFSPEGLTATTLEGAPEISLSELAAYFRSPARSYLQSLGIQLPSWVDAEADQDSDPMEVAPGLGNWALRDVIFKSCLDADENAPVPEAVRLERLMADRLLPYGAWGATLVKDDFAELTALAREVRRQAGGAFRAAAFRIPLEGVSLVADATLAADGETLVCVSTSDWEKGAVQVLFFLSACAAAASGQAAQGLFACAYQGSMQWARHALPDEKDARAALDRMVSFYLKHRHLLVEFAPETSLALLTPPAPEQLQDYARANWVGVDKKPGDGVKPENELAWRGQDPFEASRMQAWCENAVALLTPVAAFGKQIREAAVAAEMAAPSEASPPAAAPVAPAKNPAATRKTAARKSDLREAPPPTAKPTRRRTGGKA